MPTEVLYHSILWNLMLGPRDFSDVSIPTFGAHCFLCRDSMSSFSHQVHTGSFFMFSLDFLLMASVSLGKLFPVWRTAEISVLGGQWIDFLSCKFRSHFVFAALESIYFSSGW